MMERLFLECAVRAVLLVGAAATVLYVMRIKAATARYVVWVGVMMLMLLLPAWTVWGPKASLRVLPPLSQSIVEQGRTPIEIFPTGVPRLTLLSPGEAVLLGFYLSGLCWLLIRLTIGTVQAHRLVRNATLQEGVRTSRLCAAPVTIGIFQPTVIFPEHWRQWPQVQLAAVLIHESEHVRRRHPLVQWLALLNRALFWFHPAAWWLESHLSFLAEESCDNVVLARGYDPRAYSEYLIDMARSVKQSGGRLNVAGMAMPGNSLPRRIRQILEGGPAPRITRSRMACLCIASTISCTAIAAGTLDHAKPNSSAEPATVQSRSPTAERRATKFVLGELKIEGDVHDRDGVRDRILTALKSREYDDGKELVDETAGGIRRDFQERGYFQVAVHDPSSQPLSVMGGQQSMLIVVSITEGDQFRLGRISIQSLAADRPLNISTQTLREQFQLRNGDLFNLTEMRAGLEKMQQLYVDRGYPGVSVQAATEIDAASHRINLTIRVAEGPHAQ